MRSRTFATYEESKRLFELTEDFNTDFMYDSDKTIVPFDSRHIDIAYQKAVPAYSLADLIRLMKRGSKTPDYRDVLLEDTDAIDKDMVTSKLYMVSVDLSESGVQLPLTDNRYIIWQREKEEYQWLQVVSAESYIEAIIVIIYVLKENNIL